jgi:hypothetical protein
MQRETEQKTILEFKIKCQDQYRSVKVEHEFILIFQIFEPEYFLEIKKDIYKHFSLFFIALIISL